MPTQIFVDLDGVLAWWQKAIVDQVDGITWEDVPMLRVDDEKKALYKEHQAENYEFWANLPKTPFFNDIMDVIGNYNYYILSAPNSKKDKECCYGKIKWCVDNLGVSKDRVILEENKWKYATHLYSTNILLDDTAWQITRWREYGGKGVLFLPGEFRHSLKELKSTINTLVQRKKND